MRTHPQILARLVVTGLLAAAALPGRAPAAPSPNAIRSIDVAERSGAVEVDIRGSRAPSYTVFKLQEPPRLVVDLAGGDVSAIASPIRVDRGGVATVTTAQYQDERTSVGRVVIGLDPAARYEVAPRGDSVVVRVLPATAAEATTPKAEPLAASAAAPVPAGEAAAPQAGPPVASAGVPAPAPGAGTSGSAAAPAGGPGQAGPTAPAPARDSGAAPVAAAAPASADDHVVSRRLDRATSRASATAVTGARVKGQAVILETNGSVGTFEVIELRDPPRLAIDLLGMRGAPRQPVAAGAGFRQVRFGRDSGKVRVVLDAEGENPSYQVRRTPQGLAVRAAPPPVASPSGT